MPLQHNHAGVFQCRSLAKSGLIDKGNTFAPPTPEQKATYLKDYGPLGLSQWYLGVDKAAASSNDPSAYSYPYSSDFKTVSRAGIIAAMNTAKSAGDLDISNGCELILGILDGDQQTVASLFTVHDIDPNFSISVSDKISNRVRT